MKFIAPLSLLTAISMLACAGADIPGDPDPTVPTFVDDRNPNAAHYGDELDALNQRIDVQSNSP